MMQFNRQETKYVVDPLQAFELVNYLHRYVPFQKRTKELITNNRSVYFDDPQLSLYRESLQSRENHIKLRLRDYGYRGRYGRFFFAELKSRVDGVSKKQRVLLPKSRYDDLCKGEDLASLVRKHNPGDTEKSMEAYGAIAQAMRAGDYAPVTVIEYDRISFEIMLKTRVRITLDRNISFFEAGPDFSYRDFGSEGKRLHYLTLPVNVVETKLDDPEHSPEWLARGIRLFGLQADNFSKYTASIDTLLDKYRIRIEALLSPS
jgi:SPX domain protein involved in polyphosphate accumulation